MIAARSRVAATALAVATLALVAAGEPSIALRIVAPAPGALVSGEVTIAVQLEPAERQDLVKDLTVFVDGRQVCRLEAPPFTCSWDAGPTVDAHVIRVVARLTNGSRSVASTRTAGLDYAARVEVDAVQLAVVVTDAAGHFVKGLGREAFRVYEDEVPQTVSSFAAEDAPLELVAAIDVSQSMTDAMAQVKLAARAFLSALSPRDQVTLVAFNDNVFTLARRTTTIDGRARAIERLAPWGGTALYDAIIKGIDLLGRQPGRRALIVFTDGEDQSSHATADAAAARVEATDATIYPVGLGRADTVPALRALLERFAQVSGGRSLFPDRAQDLEQAFADVLQDLSNQYLLGYQPADQRRDHRWRRLRVEVSGGAHRVRHRQGYRLTATDQ